MNAATWEGAKTSTELMYIRVRVDHLDLHRKILQGTWYADTLISKVKSILDNNVANVYTQCNFVKVYPITVQREAGQSLIDFNDDVGVSETLLTDGDVNFDVCNTEFVKHTRRVRM